LSRKRTYISIIMALSLYLVFVLPVIAAGEISFREVDTSQFPKVVLMVTLSGEEEIQQQILTKENFILVENGNQLEKKEVMPISESAQPMGVVLIIDTSGSMVGQPLEDAKAAAKAFIEQMRPSDKVAIVGFGSTPYLVADFSSDKAQLNSGIAQLQTSGETALYDALVMGSDISSKLNLVQKNIIVLSDGADTQSSATLGDCISQVGESKITIFSVGLHSPEFSSVALEKISGETGGKFLLAPDSGMLGAFYSQLARDLHSQYRITYTSLCPQEKDLEIGVEAISDGLRLAGQTTATNPDYIPSTAPAEKKEVKLEAPTGLMAFMGSTQGLLLTSSLIFTAVFILSAFLLSIIFPKKSKLQERLRFYGRTKNKSGRPTTVDSEEGASGFRIFLRRISRIATPLAAVRGYGEQIQLMLMQAELPLRASEFIFLHLLFLLFAGFLGYLLAGGTMGAILFVLLAAAVPLLWIQYLINRRQKLFHDQLPDTLTLIASSLKAGYSFQQAINVVVSETMPPVSTEFKKVSTEARLGLPLDDALDNMADRVGSENFKWAVMAINVQREIGGNLAEILETVAETIRDRERVARQIKALTAEGRLSAIILFVMPFVMALFLSVTNPTYLSLLYTTNMGLLMLITVTVLMIVGGIWLKKVVSIEV